MSNAHHLSLSVTHAHNGLVLITLWTTVRGQKHLVLRTHLTLDPEEGLPDPASLLTQASLEAARCLRGR